MPFQPIQKALRHKVALPAAETDLLENNISPTNPPSTFKIQVSFSVSGKFYAQITRGGDSIGSWFNGGAALATYTLYTFELLVHAGDNINFRYDVSGGVMDTIRVQEIETTS